MKSLPSIIYNTVYNLVAPIYTSIYSRYFSCQVEFKPIPNDRIPDGVLDLGMSLYNIGYVKGKGFRVININYNSRRVQ